MAKKGEIATVLAFEKKLVPSDGFMYGTNWDEGRKADGLKRDKAEWQKLKPEERNALIFPKPLVLQEKSVRGTISNRLKKAVQNDPLKLNAEVEKPNLQRVDSCALGTDQDTLKLSFTLKVLSGVEKPSACNNNVFQEKYQAAATAYIQAEGFSELAKRYALNIANGRFFWRNRVGVEKLEVVVTASDSGKSWTFNAKEFSTRDMNTKDAQVLELAESIATALSGKEDFLLLEIDAYALVGRAQDIYPSEELVLDKSNSKSGKSKILYSVNEVAAMHSQKIGNALRTIDTWYPEYAEVPTGPIAIEPYGAVTNLGKAYRNPSKDNKKDFYTLFDDFALGNKLASIEDEHYVMAVLVRGGVFGESGKE